MEILAQLRQQRARFSVSISFWAMRWAPQGLHRRVADPVLTPQCLHGTGDFRSIRSCWRWVPQYSYTQFLPQISRELTLSQGQILVAPPPPPHSHMTSVYVSLNGGFCKGWVLGAAEGAGGGAGKRV